LLGPGRRSRNTEVMIRPYPIRNSAEPTLLLFDIESKYATVILEASVVVDAPTVLYIPYHFHYSPTFIIWATNKEMEWDKQNQLLYWYPAKYQTLNQIIIAKEHTYNKAVDLINSRLPKRARDLVEKATEKAIYVNTFS